jgi:hypothetical protein
MKQPLHQVSLVNRLSCYNSAERAKDLRGSRGLSRGQKPVENRELKRRQRAIDGLEGRRKIEDHRGTEGSRGDGGPFR